MDAQAGKEATAVLRQMCSPCLMLLPTYPHVLIRAFARSHCSIAMQIFAWPRLRALNPRFLPPCTCRTILQCHLYILVAGVRPTCPTLWHFAQARAGVCRMDGPLQARAYLPSFVPFWPAVGLWPFWAGHSCFCPWTGWGAGTGAREQRHGAQNPRVDDTCPAG